jgi:hypothetical protein
MDASDPCAVPAHILRAKIFATTDNNRIAAGIFRAMQPPECMSGSREKNHPLKS